LDLLSDIDQTENVDQHKKSFKEEQYQTLLSKVNGDDDGDDDGDDVEMIGMAKTTKISDNANYQ